MMEVIVAGAGCETCQKLFERCESAVAALGLEGQVHLRKAEDLLDMVALGVMDAPALLIDGVQYSAGSLVDERQLRLWLEEAERDRQA